MPTSFEVQHLSKKQFFGVNPLSPARAEREDGMQVVGLGLAITTICPVASLHQIAILGLQREFWMVIAFGTLLLLFCQLRIVETRRDPIFPILYVSYPFVIWQGIICINTIVPKNELEAWLFASLFSIPLLLWSLVWKEAWLGWRRSAWRMFLILFYPCLLGWGVTRKYAPNSILLPPLALLPWAVMTHSWWARRNCIQTTELEQGNGENGM